MYKKHSLFFDAKLSGIGCTRYKEEEMHILHLKLSFMWLFDQCRRIKGAKVEVKLAPDSGVERLSSPKIQRIRLEADLVQISDQELTSSWGLAAGGLGNGGPTTLSLNVEGTKAQRTTFKGI